ncbi:CRISPR-associated endoribonuclease Cas6 1 [Methanocaldococcus lauensis]|uniref:CRISPR-associated endoribonuclease Cas6 1 n=1 Tax=Methanocaldococcus lauensis TaxID=2546128 RepID=A0A8D6PVR5_9EURY|nr:CRISPR-associated endoribonuclease Cas6 [Methanocaldococcus lauensis]CAB3288362.1 CRISPR-associated endoribonuclease Cas6 1 [Methanocaldococcus lauensis]
MRMELELQTDNFTVIPYNHQYYLASAIYNKIHSANPEYAERLHNYQKFKFFTFSLLQIRRRVIRKEGIETIDGKAYLYISSPKNEFIENFVEGLLEDGELRVGKINFYVKRAKILPIPKKFNILKTISPIYLKTIIPTEDNKLKTYDLHPNNSKFYENLKNNLKKKYEAFYNEKCDLNFEFEVLKYKPKRMRIKDIYCRCSEMVFKVWGDYELIKFGYECGFGEKNSMGFGMVMNIDK